MPRQRNWVFGIVSTNFLPARGFYKVVRNRDRATLVPIIKSFRREVLSIQMTGVHTITCLTHAPNVATHNVVN